MAHLSPALFSLDGGVKGCAHRWGELNNDRKNAGQSSAVYVEFGDGEGDEGTQSVWPDAGEGVASL